MRLRELHVALDYAVRDAYGWGELELGHGFHDTRFGIRYTFEPVARQEVLDRLLELNHERYADEVRRGLHGKPKAKRHDGRAGATDARCADRLARSARELRDEVEQLIRDDLDRPNRRRGTRSCAIAPVDAYLLGLLAPRLSHEHGAPPRDDDEEDDNAGPTSCPRTASRPAASRPTRARRAPQRTDRRRSTSSSRRRSG